MTEKKKTLSPGHTDSFLLFVHTDNIFATVRVFFSQISTKTLEN